EWTLTCTAKVPGSIAYSVAIYANGQTYMSNKVTVTVNNSSATTTQAAPSVTITSPSAGQTYIAGQTIPITWNSTGDTYGKVNIQLWQYYSTGGRGSSPAVTVSDSGSGAYNWVLPANQPAGTYSVSATLWGQDVTGWTGQFAIAAPASTQSFTVNSITPTSGPVGAPVTINASIPASGNYEIHFGNGGKTVSLSSGTQNINYAIPTGVSGCDFWTSNYACTLPVQAVAPGTYPVYISYTGPNGTNNSSNQVNFTVTASSVATTTQSAPTLSVSLSPTNPPVQDIAMGTTNVVLASYRLTNNNGEAVTVQGIGMIVGGDIRYSSVASNFRLMSGSTVIASGVNPASGQLKWSGINYEIPQGGYVDLNVVADINTWSALQPLGLENSTTNPTVQVALTGVNFIGASSGLNRSLGIQGIPGGSVMQVLRTNLTATPANVNLGSAFSPNELVGAFTFTNIGTDAATPYAQLDGISINLNLANSSASKATTTIRFADASGNILGSYQANIGINTGYALNGLGGAPTIPIGSSLTVYVYADTAINGINVRPVGSNIPIAINTSLTYYNWSDMTRTAIAPNPYPANALPVSGGMATVALNQPSNADELANVLQSIQGVLTELKSFGL
ncbi:MAG: GPI anchored serine-threonine rich family protein, partial [Patescibacteria group bacterium]|nr:GPI anchored serine-threonine rich family protein [Patescibacteria group bacterium]